MCEKELFKTKDERFSVINQKTSALSRKLDGRQACLAALLVIINQKIHNNFQHSLS